MSIPPLLILLVIAALSAGGVDSPAQKGSQGKQKPMGSASKKETKDTTSKEKKPAEMKFSWPVPGRKIVTPYGERVNPKTNTVTLNPGINIAASRGGAVRAAGDGKVSLVTWLPGFGTIVIIAHRDGYRTVYANLSSALVPRGRTVRAGEKIGLVGESRDGQFLHFEVWQGRVRRDPLAFLK
jgi:murein DD-endopeptidase MepM/ murein hydrolase activator NlpD